MSLSGHLPNLAAVADEKLAEGHTIHLGTMSVGGHTDSPESPLDKSGTPGGKDDKSMQLKRRKVTKACLYCQKSHMSCDKERPCKRCVQRNIQHLCRDMDGKRRGRKGSYLNSEMPGVKAISEAVQAESPLSLPTPAVDILFAGIDDITPMLYQFDRVRAIEDEKLLSGDVRHMGDDKDLSAPMSNFWNMMLQRLPGGMQNEVQMARSEIEGIKRKILISRIPNDADLEVCKKDVAMQVKNWSATFSPLEIPVAIWERNLHILDYNKTFTEICGGHFPNPDNEASLLRLLTVTSIVNLLRSVTHLMKNPTCDVTNFNCSWQLQLPSGLSYAEGVCWLVVRRDPLQIPCVFLGVFTPGMPMSGVPALREPK